MERRESTAILRDATAKLLTREVLSGVPTRQNPEDHIQYLVDYFDYFKNPRHQAISLAERNPNHPVIENAIEAALKRPGLSRKTIAALKASHKDPFEAPVSELPEDAIDAIYEDIAKNSEKLIEYILRYEPAELPSWAILELRVVERVPSWLVHETTSDAANHICSYGFLYGTEDTDALSFTTHRRTETHPGYDFASQTDFYHCGRYGSARLIFLAPHVVVYHYGDMEYQAIFWGEDAEKITQVYGDCGDFVIYHPETDEEYHSRTIDDIIEIVEGW